MQSMPTTPRSSPSRCFRFRAIFVVALAMAGCAANTPVAAPKLTLAPLPGPQQVPYRLQNGDVLDIKFWGNPELDQEVTVRPDGQISLPFVDEVHATGLTPAQLDDNLTKRYTGELAKPEITVIVKQAAGQAVYVGGEVGDQRLLPLNGPMTMFQAIQAAGGFKTTAYRRQVVLIRTEADGQRLARSVDMLPVLSGADPAADPQLQASDIIFVPRTKITNANLFVDQYIFQMLGVRPILTIPLVQDPLFGTTKSSNTTSNSGSSGSASSSSSPPP
jgi:protein involved in polysaccharide export with SLBB domain